MAAVAHQHVVPVYTVDEHRGLPFFAMEYVAGGTLEARLRQDGPLDILSIVRISRQVALALAAAHDCGLVHRDIKPANILLDRGVERVRVTDFGLARVSNDASYTRSGLIVGTPQFMSPEQVRGETCDAQSDLFSLGSVVYAMCTGHSPFRAESLYGAMQRIVHDLPRSIRELNPDMPEWIEQFVERLLEKRPSDRFDSATTVAQLLEAEQAHLQSPDPHVAPNRRWMEDQRHTIPQKHVRRRMRVVVALIIPCFLAAIAWTVWLVVSTNGPAKRNSASAADTLPPPSDVPLWNADGTDELIGSSNALRASLFDHPTGQTDDAWSESVEDLRQRMNEFEGEPLF